MSYAVDFSELNIIWAMSPQADLAGMTISLATSCAFFLFIVGFISQIELDKPHFFYQILDKIRLVGVGIIYFYFVAICASLILSMFIYYIPTMWVQLECEGFEESCLWREPVYNSLIYVGALTYVFLLPYLARKVGVKLYKKIT